MDEEMWEEVAIEKETKRVLTEEFGDRGREIFNRYEEARTGLLIDVLPWIPAIEPELTDHGPDHVKQVLEYSYKLIRPNHNTKSYPLRPIEMFFLILCIVFHDAGNIEGRQNHQHNVANAYDHVRSRASSELREKTLLLKVVGAHSGKTATGSIDTLAELENGEHLFSESLRLREVAALLRFSDELSEGRLRTSRYMIDAGKFQRGNQVYHDYADAVSMHIDGGNNRIAISFDIAVEVGGRRGNRSIENEGSFRDLLDFIQLRVMKVNAERRYARYYCQSLEPFKETSVTLTLHVNGEILDLGLRPAVFTDLEVPPDPEKAKRICDQYPEYSTQSILDCLLEANRRR